MLPVSDPPNEEDRDWLLKSENKTFRGRRIYAAVSYMLCAGSAHFYYLVFGAFFIRLIAKIKTTFHSLRAFRF